MRGLCCDTSLVLPGLWVTANCCNGSAEANHRLKDLFCWREMEIGHVVRDGRTVNALWSAAGKYVGLPATVRSGTCSKGRGCKINFTTMFGLSPHRELSCNKQSKSVWTMQQWASHISVFVVRQILIWLQLLRQETEERMLFVFYCHLRVFAFSNHFPAWVGGVGLSCCRWGQTEHQTCVSPSGVLKWKTVRCVN